MAKKDTTRKLTVMEAVAEGIIPNPYGWDTVDGGHMKIDDWTDLAAALLQKRDPIEIDGEWTTEKIAAYEAGDLPYPDNVGEIGDNWFDDGNVELIVSTDGKVADREADRMFDADGNYIEGSTPGFDAPSDCDYPGMEIDANHPGWHPYHPYAVHWYEFGNDHDVRIAPERMTETMNGIEVMPFLANLKANGRRGWAVMLPK